MNNQLLEEIFQNAGKYNTSVKLTTDDQKSRVKIFCKEPYAQEMYNVLAGLDKNKGFAKKDLRENEVYSVKANTISYSDKTIYAEEVNSKCTIIIPFREYSKPLENLANGSSTREFLVTIYRATENGEYYASEKKALSISYKEELFTHLKENTWFDVKIIKLIKGGYLAVYNKEVECFIPGSHAAANIIHNFSDLLGKTITVMVDNYDASNNLFILSYKKYITHSMPTMISELKFDKEYSGTLTTRPYDFGIFVELENYYTGLVHKSEFENYEEVMKTLKSGDKINVYVKDVGMKGSDYRIMLTLNKDKVNDEKQRWQILRNKTENQSFKYKVDEAKSSISIEIDGESFEVALRKKDFETNLNKYSLIKVLKVDPINKRLGFEFVEKKV